MRKLIFKVLQKVKGNNFFNNIRFMEENYDNYSDSLIDERFNELLKHAINTTTYYREYKSNQPLKKYPIISKEDIKDNYDGFLSNLYNKDDDLVSTTTSGSYGTPFTFYFTKEKKEVQRSDVIFFSRWANYDVGVKHGYIMSREKSKINQLIQNQYSITPYKITEEWLEEQRNLIKNKKLKVLIGYPSGIGPIAKHFLLNNDFYQLDGVISVSETLTDIVREDVKEAFGVVPLSRYTTEELGVLAMECPAEQHLHFNNVNFIIEVVDENGKAVQPGEQGEVVVTDLYSHAMPLIRYRTGDLAVLGSDNCACGLKTPYLKNLSGRKLENIYTPDGEVVSSMAINANMRDVSGIRQFQFIQTGKKEYTFNLVKIGNEFNETALMNKFKAILGEETEFIFNYLDDIPPLNSGKRPYILQHYYKE